MRILHIIPKDEFSVPVAADKFVLIKEICSSQKGKKWHLRTKTDWNVSDMDALTASLKEKLFLQGEVSVDNEREIIRHGGDMPLSQTDATLQSVANVDVSDLDGYDIPHEDMYEFDDDWMKDDPDYQKACRAAQGETVSAGSGKSNASKSGGTSNSRVWLGKAFTGEPIPINDIVGEERPAVIFRGKVVKVDFRETKTKRIILNFQIADKTNGISAQKFLEVGKGGNSKYRRRNTLTEDEFSNLKSKLCPGAVIRVHGDVKFSEYLNDYVLNVDSIMEDAKCSVEREDTNPTPRVELHLHTVMSDMDALITVKQLIKTIKKWKHPAVAVTDHGVVQSFPLLQEISNRSK